MNDKLSVQLFELDPKIRYVAVNRNGNIVEMEQSPRYPTNNPHESDRLEELIVNPIVLEITRRRGKIDMGGVHYVIIRYGTMYQLILPFKDGHLSVGVESGADPIAIADKVVKHLKTT